MFELSLGMLISFFSKNRLSFGKNRFFSDYRIWASLAVALLPCRGLLGRAALHAVLGLLTVNRLTGLNSRTGPKNAGPVNRSRP